MRKNIVLLATITLLVTACSQSGTIPDQPKSPYSNLAGGATTPGVQPIDNFNVQPDQHQYTAPQRAEIFNINVQDDAIYPTAYYTLNGGDSWNAFKLTGDQTIQNWLLGSANANLTLSGQDITRGNKESIIIYSCSYKPNEQKWNCHDNWQRHTLTLTKKRCDQLQCLVNGTCIDNQETINGKICIGGQLTETPETPDTPEKPDQNKPPSPPWKHNQTTNSTTESQPPAIPQ